MDRLDSIAAIGEEAIASPDPWSGLVFFMERMAETMAGNLGLRQMLMFATYGRDLVAVARQRNAPLVERLVQRAQAAGRLRADIRQTDIIFIVFVLIEATQLSHAANPDIWRRSYPDPGRHATRPGGGHPASGARHAAGGDGEEHATGRAMAALTLSGDLPLSGPYSRNPQIDLHLHVHAQSVNE